LRYLNIIRLFLLVFFLSCSRWEYDDLSEATTLNLPETYLSLLAVDTIYASEDSLGNPIYAIGEEPDPGLVWDTLAQAFTTITTSRQELHWWGEDPDGNVMGYY